MKVAELMEALAELPPDAEVRVAEQPSCPMEYGICEPVLVEVVPVARYNDDIAGPVVYLPEAEHVGYLPGVVAVELGWR